MAKAVRVLIYDGPDEWIAATLDASYMHDGDNPIGEQHTITARTWRHRVSLLEVQRFIQDEVQG